MFFLRALRDFWDLDESAKQNTKITRTFGEIFSVEDPERVRFLTGSNPKSIKYADIYSATKRNGSNNGKKIIFSQGQLFYIGGIETFLYNLVKTYRDKDITIVANNMAVEQFIHISEYANIEIGMNKVRDCDVLILGNYDGQKYLDKFNAKKVYQMVHADLEGLSKATPSLHGLTWIKHPKVDKVITVSDSAHDGLMNLSNTESEVIYNILDKDFEDDDTKIFVTMSRATVEKGIYRMIEMAKKFKEANKHFLWFISCSLEQIKNRQILCDIRAIPEFIIIPPSIYNKAIIKNCDYLVQLSDTESFCYSAFEALQRGVPVILTDFPEAKKIVKDGENGYIVKMDLSNLDVDKIFQHKPMNIEYEDRCDYLKWEKVFEGKL